MKPIRGVNVVLSQDSDGDKMFLINNEVIDNISNNKNIAVGLFPQSRLVNYDTIKTYSFDALLNYALDKKMPLVGIIEWPYYNSEKANAYEVPVEVVDKVISAGGIPVGIFPTQVCSFQQTRLSDMPELLPCEKKDLEDVLSFMDGVIKPGAFKAYEFDKYIHSYTVANNMPYFGICAGMQIMTYPEGKLVNTNPNDDVADVELHSAHNGYAHDIIIAHDTRLYDILKKDRIMVNSKHKKCIPRKSLENFIISAEADDKTVEAIEIADKAFQIGVQWHPELLDDEYTDKIFGSFIEESKTYSLYRK